MYSAKELFPHVGDFEDGSFLFPRDWRGRRNGEERTPTPGSTSSPSPPSPVCSPGKNGRRAEHHSYQQPTVSSRSHALSPYTHRKMCQLSEDTRQRLGHLQLGPHRFKKETALQTPFLVGNTWNLLFRFLCKPKSCLLSKLDLLSPVFRAGHSCQIWWKLSDAKYQQKHVDFLFCFFNALYENKDKNNNDKIIKKISQKEIMQIQM